MREVELFTDGSCDTTTGKGGWAFILRFKDTGEEIKLSGKDDDTTNNRMEMSAVIEGLQQLEEPCLVELWADSKYVLEGLRSWLINWKKNGWKKSNKKPVKNRDLWEKLDELKKTHKLSYNWVKGHNNHPENEEVDRMAVEIRQ